MVDKERLLSFTALSLHLIHNPLGTLPLVVVEALRSQVKLSSCRAPASRREVLRETYPQVMPCFGPKDLRSSTSRHCSRSLGGNAANFCFIFSFTLRRGD